MVLLELSNEIILQILSNIFEHSDYINLALTCQRLSLCALLLIYQHIQLKLDRIPDNILIDLSKLESLISSMTAHPERGSWVQTVGLEWPEHYTTERPPQIFQFLAKLTRLRSLSLKIIDSRDWVRDGHTSRWYRVGRDRVLGLTPMEVLCRSLPSSTLRTLTIHDQRITVAEIMQLYATFPSMSCLKVTGFDITESTSPGKLSHSSSNITNLEFWRSSPPIIDLFNGHPKMAKVTWIIEHRLVNDLVNDYNQLSPLEISIALSPIRSQLVELNLSVTAFTKNSQSEHDNYSQLNLLEFNSLKVLKAHNRLIGASSRHNPDGNDLPVWLRLPSSLRTLTVLFDRLPRNPSEAREWWFNGDWVFGLAEQKEIRFPQLSRLRIMQRQYRPPDSLNGTEWEYPTSVKKALNSAGINL